MGWQAIIGAASLAMGLASSAQAQFMTAADVKPILKMTQSSWLAVREFNGQDLLYFTQLVTFRCGLEEVFYGLNGETPSQPLPIEPCHEGTANPAAMDPATYPPYITLPLGSVRSVSLMMMYDDGDIQEASFERAQIQMQ